MATAIKKGLIYVSQLYTEAGDLLDYEAIKTFGLNWLEYKQITSAIPVDWRGVKNWEETHYDLLKPVKNKTAKVYSNLIDTYNPLLLLHNRACKYVECELDEYEYAFRRIHYVTTITKYRDFQYRLLISAIPANDRLYHWKVVNSQKCNWCEDKQTIVHLMYTCPKVVQYWQGVFQFIEDKVSYSGELSKTLKDIWLGQVIKTRGHIVNLIILIAKQYLYSRKCLNKDLKSNKLIQLVEDIQRMERYNAYKSCNKKKIQIHVKKWHPITGAALPENPLQNDEL